MLSRFSSILISWCPDFQTSMIDDCCMKNVQSSLLLISQSEELWALRYTTSLVLGSLTLIFLPVLPTFLIKSKLYPFQFHERENQKVQHKSQTFQKCQRFFAVICLFFSLSGQMSSSADWKGIEFLYLFQPKSQYVNGLGASRLKSSC